MSNLEYSKSQLLTFSSGSSKLDNILRMGKPVGKYGGLGFKENYHNVAGISKTIFVPTTDQPKHVPNPQPRDKGSIGQRSTR